MPVKKNFVIRKLIFMPFTSFSRVCVWVSGSGADSVQLLLNLFGALSDQWELWLWSVLFWAWDRRIKGCVCFCWTCCNGHVLVGGGLSRAITWPCGAYAFTQHTQELSRHVSYSQSYSADWTEVRWGGWGVGTGRRETWNSKDRETGVIRTGRKELRESWLHNGCWKMRRNDEEMPETSRVLFGLVFVIWFCSGFVWCVVSIYSSWCLLGSSWKMGDVWCRIMKGRGRTQTVMARLIETIFTQWTIRQEILTFICDGSKSTFALLLHFRVSRLDGKRQDTRRRS